MGWADIVAAARRGEGPLRHARTMRRWLVGLRLPVFRPLAALLYAERDLRHELWPLFLQFVYREPLLRYRCASVGHRVRLEGELPLIVGNGTIRIGDEVLIGGRNAWAVGYKASVDAQLTIGNRVTIGYLNQFSVARKLTIGDDSMLAPNVYIFDNPNHPTSPGARLRHEDFSLDDAADVTIGSNVWIGTSAMIMRGVTIGDGAVVGARAIVTRDVPAASLVAGNPARTIRELGD